MAEVVASVIGITTFGVKLVDTLYDFGCNVSSAREQSSRIGDRIDDYITILDILAGLLEEETALISDKATSMVDKLCDQSEDLFYDIYDLLPRCKDDGKVAWMDRIAWNFRKPKVEMLLAQIEYIKSNVLLLVMTTLVGKRIRRRRKKNKAKNDRDSELQHHAKRAQNAIVQHMNAGDKLAALERDLEQSDAAAATASSTSDDDKYSSTAIVKSTAPHHTAVVLLSRQVEAIGRFQNAMISLGNASQRQSYVMEQSPSLLKELLEEWTTIVGAPDELSSSRSNSATLRIQNTDSLNDIQVEGVPPPSLPPPPVQPEHLPSAIEDDTATNSLPNRPRSQEFTRPPRRVRPKQSSQPASHPAAPKAPAPTPEPISPSHEYHPSPLVQVDLLDNLLQTDWKPAVGNFVHSAPTDPELCRREYTRLTEGIMATVILPADNVGIPPGDDDEAAARMARKQVIADAQALLRRLDTKMGYWRKT